MGVPPAGSASNPRTTTKVFAIVVTYRPNILDLQRTLHSALPEVDQVLIVDNTPEPWLKQQVSACVEAIADSAPAESCAKPIRLAAQGENIGLSKAYNIGLRTARDSGSNFVLLLDQDSQLVPGAIRILLDAYFQLSSASPVGAVCCRNLKSFSASLSVDEVLESIKRKKSSLPRSGDSGTPKLDYTEVSLFTNSGALIPLSHAVESGGFDEDLFVDSVDYDFSLRLASRGLRIFVIESARVFHKQGEPLRRNLLGKAVDLRSYSPIRSYYILVDTLRFCRKWIGRYPRIVIGILGTMSISTLGAMVLLPDKAERLGQVLRALRDYRNLPSGISRPV